MAIIPEVERALAVLGIRTVIFGEIEKLRAVQKHEMSSLENRIHSLASKLVAGEELPMEETDIDYRPMLKALSEGITVPMVEKTIESFPPGMEEVATLLTVHVSQIVNELIQFIPKSEYVTLTGTQPLAPSDTRLWRFFSVIDVLNDPLSVFGLMSHGALLKTQAKAMRAVFPGLSKVIDGEITAAIEKEKAAKLSFELTPKAEYGIRSWSFLPPLSPKMMALTQANATELSKKADLLDKAQARPEHRNLSERAEFQATTPQKIDANL